MLASRRLLDSELSRPMSVAGPQAQAAPSSQNRFDSGFTQLDAQTPLLLLPVRLETIFAKPVAQGNLPDPRKAAKSALDLLVRIYPDDLHADMHVRGVTASEIELGRRFWTRAWPSSTTRQQMETAFARLASRLGAFRAAWTLEATRPLNWNTRTADSKLERPQFGEPPSRDASSPGKARLLPDRWIVTGYQHDELVFSQEGKPIPRDLALAPTLAGSGPTRRTMSDLLDVQGLTWLRRFDAAEAKGMALRVPLGNLFQPDAPLDLFVVGVRSGDSPVAIAGQLADLLAAHHWTHGVDFVRRGSPTNNSDRATSAVSLSEPDTNALLDTVLTRPALPDRRTELSARTGFGAAAARALGLAPGSILERVAHRDDAQLELASAMSAALWPATWGYFLRTMLGDALSEQWIEWTRRHFITSVKGGGSLPALRIGLQPYGIHPVAIERVREQPVDTTDQLENLLLGLLPAWDDAVSTRVARLDVETTNRQETGTTNPSPLGEATATLARILGATPNPSDLTLTPVTDQTGLYEVRWGLLLFLLDIAISPDFPEIASQLGTDLAAANSLETQIAVLESLISPVTPGPGNLYFEAHATANDGDEREAAQQALDLIEGYVLPLLYNHRERTALLLERKPDRDTVTGLMADADDPPLFFSLFGESAERIPWTGPLIARQSATADDVRAWLDALRVEAADPTRPAAAPGEHPPLLFQLLKRAVAKVHDRDRADLLAGLTTLASAAADGRMNDPIGDLDTLMGEVLGTCMHRIDAWLAAGAAASLTAARKTKPQGLEIGGFGWVLGLERSDGPATSQGFIHAPSLDHAATAAILRSGWSAFGDGALGVDVSSARARAASWIVDGVRDGHRLGELIGQSLERRLHDASLDRWIEPIRRATLDGTGRSNARAAAIVDGFLVARAWLGGDEVAPLSAEEEAVRDELRKVVNGAGGDEGQLRTVLKLNAADLDAVADASLFASVHALVRGNPERAAATLAATGTTASAPPPLTALRTSRGGQRISHRLLLTLDGSLAPDEAAPPPAIAEPALDAWVSRTLPLDRIGFGVWIEENGSTSWQGPYTLASAGFTGLDLLADLPSGDSVGTGARLTRRLTWAFERQAAGAGRTIAATLDADLSGGTSGGLLPLALALAAAQALRALVYEGRAADDADFALASATVASTVDNGAVTSRATMLATATSTAATRLRTALDVSATTDHIIDACAALAAWQIDGAITRAGLRDLATGDDASDREKLLLEAAKVQRRMQDRIDACAAVQGVDLTAAMARIRALLPGAIILPPFSPANIGTLRAAETRSSSRLGAPENASPWLHQAGDTREHVQTAAVAIDLVEAATGVTAFRPTLLQLPDYEGEGWAATSLPSRDASPRTCMLSLTPLPAAVQFAAIAIDAWTEAIPDRTATTGIAVHIDAPSARAPQVWLLATPPRGNAWTHDTVLSLVRQTVARLRQRAAGLAEIEGFGQYLPAVYLDDATDPGPMPNHKGGLESAS